MLNPNGPSDEEIDIMKEDQLDQAMRESAAQFGNEKLACHVIAKWYWLGQKSISDNLPQDIEAGGIVFCGKCGKQK